MNHDTASAHHAQRRWPWVLLGLAVLAIRWPLWHLPGPGRDEAAYYYWAHHPEFSYAPLLQLAVRLSEMLTGPGVLWGLRAPVILLGGAVLVTNDRRLAYANTPAGGRWLAAAAVALTPWQSFAGSILHPDVFLLTALLGIVLAHQHGRLWLLVGAALAAVLAKPTGVLCLPVVWQLVGHIPAVPPRQRGMARAALILTALSLATCLRPEMISAMANFGHLAPETNFTARFMTMTTALLFEGGPLLLAMAIIGGRQRWRHLHQSDPASPTYREARAALSLAAVMIVVFLAAAVLRGQFKGNWILPTAVLLWPLHWSAPTKNHKHLITVGLILTAITAAGQTVIMVHPSLMNRLEAWTAARHLAPSWIAYSTTAGVREAHVSSGRSWHDHLRQYSDAAPFARSIRAKWAAASDTPLDWIISDDYGLACQLQWYLGQPATRVAIAHDGIFHSTWQRLIQAAPTGPMLQISGTSSENQLSPHLESQTILSSVIHPVTGQPLRTAIVTWNATPTQE